MQTGSYRPRGYVAFEITDPKRRVVSAAPFRDRVGNCDTSFRLATDLKFLDLRRYEHAARAIDEIGRLVGGWQRLSRAAEAP